MVIRRIAGVVRIMAGRQAHKSHYPTSWKDLPDYVQAMRLVRPYGASPSRLSMMWTVGQLQQHCGSTKQDLAVQTSEVSVLTSIHQVEELSFQLTAEERQALNLLTGKPGL